MEKEPLRYKKSNLTMIQFPPDADGSTVGDKPGPQTIISHKPALNI